MLRDQLGAASGDGPIGPHFAPKAKHLIFLFMTGGPSHMDLLDPKPALKAYAGQRPDSVDLRTERMTGGLLPSPFEFRRHGQSGIEVSELLPNLGGIVDDLCIIRSMYTFNPTHTPARGSRTALALRTEICPDSSSSAPGPAAATSGGPAFSPRSIRGLTSTTPRLIRKR